MALLELVPKNPDFVSSEISCQTLDILRFTHFESQFSCGSFSVTDPSKRVVLFAFSRNFLWSFYGPNFCVDQCGTWRIPRCQGEEKNRYKPNHNFSVTKKRCLISDMCTLIPSANKRQMIHRFFLWHWCLFKGTDHWRCLRDRIVMQKTNINICVWFWEVLYGNFYLGNFLY